MPTANTLAADLGLAELPPAPTGERSLERWDSGSRRQVREPKSPCGSRNRGYEPAHSQDRSRGTAPTVAASCRLQQPPSDEGKPHRSLLLVCSNRQPATLREVSAAFVPLLPCPDLRS